MTRALEGRTAIVTGASQGLGKAIASAYLAAGANVVLCARDAKLVAAAAAELGKAAGDAQRVVALAADVTREKDVSRVVGTALERFGALEILVNNAGVYGPIGRSDEVPWQAWEDAISINLLGSVRFAREVVPHFRSSGYGKIIQVSGGGATKPLPRLSAYAASKAGVVRFAETLAEELREFNVDVNSIAPGALNTRLLDEVLDAGAETAGAEFFDSSQRQRAQGGTPLEIPARLTVFLGSAASDGITGKLISAVWDDWQAFPGHLQALRESDVYTLRRIAARDRGFDWGDK
jgi:NAD(P)-dependent dehydrogenase (short-subunit alcohol dehydrogenase family)